MLSSSHGPSLVPLTERTITLLLGHFFCHKGRSMELFNGYLNLPKVEFRIEGKHQLVRCGPYVY